MLHTKESLNKIILSLIRVHDPTYEVLGLIELNQRPNSSDYDEGSLIPLEILVHNHDLIHEDKYYTPQLWQNLPPALPLNVLPNVDASILPLEALPLPTVPSIIPHEHTEERTGDYQNDDKSIAVSNSTGYDDPWQNYEYFWQYGRLDIHNEMLKDDARTIGYKNAINALAEDIKGKVVLDIGTGTGILSYFCAMAGAAKVYAVEASSLAEWTELVVSHNKFSDKIIVVPGKVEDISLPEKVDVIISEWMGTFLIFESMLESVLHARDRLLKPDGILLPAAGNIYLSPICVDKLYAEKIDFWRKVYEVDMSPLIPLAKKCAFEKPIIDKPIDGDAVLADPILVKSINLKTVPINEPYDKTIVPFEFVVKKGGNLHGFAAWFDVFFTGSVSREAITLSTSPSSKDTHWHQDLFLFNDPVQVTKGQLIKGTIRYQRNPQLLRHLIIDISFQVDEGSTQSKKFYLWGPEGQS